MPELVRNPFLELFGENMLEDFGLLVDAIPGNVELIGEESLEQTVMADHLEGHPPALFRELDASIAVVPRECELVESLDHRRCGPRTDVEVLGKRSGRHGRGAPLVERIDRLKVVLYGLGEVAELWALRGCHQLGIRR